MSIIRTAEDIQNLRYSARILASLLYHVSQKAKPGVSAGDLNRFAIEFIRSYDAEPAFLGLYGYPDALITEVNEVVVHGLSTDDNIIPQRCIVSFDCGVKYNKMFSDACILLSFGELSERERLLVDKTRESLYAGIATVRAGSRVGDIGAAVDKVLQPHNLGNVTDLGGHGLGYVPHDDPFISHSAKAGTGSRLFENQVIAIEPMVTLGTGDIREVPIKGSKVTQILTPNGEWSAHIEHTVLVTKSGYEILTELKDGELLPIKE